MALSPAREQRTYADAITALNGIQSNYATIEAVKKSGRSLNIHSIPDMRGWCRKIGYESSDLDSLNIIHVAGTKGKGSTSAFVSSILAQYIHNRSSDTPIIKIGLYTSPHLRFVRERIRINNEPIPEPLFAKYFFEVWDRFEDAAREEGKPTDATAKPMYFRFLTLMAFHTFKQEGVNTAVIECGIGGEYDCTNIIEKPTTTGITSLGIDHTVLLGETIEDIAWHKAGIMKVGVKAYTAPQPAAAMLVLDQRAKEKGVDLRVVNEDPRLDDVNLGLAADFQKVNASLGIQLAAAHLNALEYPDPLPHVDSTLPQQFVSGLEQVHWPGRCEVRQTKGISWHIDGGHTLESISLVGRWFGSRISTSSETIRHDKSTRILLFNQQTRDAPALAKALHETLSKSLGGENPFSHVVFCTNITSVKAGYKPDLANSNTNSRDVEEMSVQKALKATWQEMDPQATVEVRASIEAAVLWIKEIVDVRKRKEKEEDVMALVTGSLHLVGGFLDVLESEADP